MFLLQFYLSSTNYTYAPREVLNPFTNKVQIVHQHDGLSAMQLQALRENVLAAQPELNVYNETDDDQNFTDNPSCYHFKFADGSAGSMEKPYFMQQPTIDMLLYSITEQPWEQAARFIYKLAEVGGMTISPCVDRLNATYLPAGVIWPEFDLGPLPTPVCVSEDEFVSMVPDWLQRQRRYHDAVCDILKKERAKHDKGEVAQ